MAMYGRGITRGKVAITGLEAATNQACAAITPTNREERTTEFLYWFLRYRYEELRSRGHGANQRNLSMTLIKIFEIAYPPLFEQKKTAHILSTVQRAIEAQERIIQTTTELKKAPSPKAGRRSLWASCAKSLMERSRRAPSVASFTKKNIRKKASQW